MGDVYWSWQGQVYQLFLAGEEAHARLLAASLRFLRDEGTPGAVPAFFMAMLGEPLDIGREGVEDFCNCVRHAVQGMDRAAACARKYTERIRKMTAR